jgi:hypothetical protein
LDESYLRDGGDLGLFLDGFPTDRGSQVMWTVIRRKALADALYRHADSEPLIRVRRVAVSGVPLHLHSSGAQHVDDHFTRGIDRLGPLGYSLLRGHHLANEHAEARLEALSDVYEDLIAGVIGAREDAVQRPDWLYRERACLVFWDVLGMLHQETDKLAALFSAWQLWLGAQGDLGEVIVRMSVQGWKVIHSSPFGSRAVWRRVLGVPPEREGMAGLSVDQRRSLSALIDQTEALFMNDVQLLRRIWTRDLHRAATRYKHSQLTEEQHDAGIVATPVEPVDDRFRRELDAIGFVR